MNPTVNDDLRLREIIDDALRRRQRGESVSDETILAAHPELSRPLAESLKRVRLIAAARALAEQSPSSSAQLAALLNIRCPRCANAVPAPADTEWDQILCPTCSNTFRLGVGQSLAGHVPRRIAHFELLRPLGQGSFGEVWEADDTNLDRRVAIKLPRRGELSARETGLFLREARAAAQLRHPNLVAVFEVGQTDGQCYIVSELVSGQPLSRWAAARGPNSMECARLFVTIAQAMDHAHRAGVVHRDLKPANVLIDALDQPHLLDFGLAKRETGEATMTLDGQVLGTVAYMSPEQARGAAHECTPASDIYSLGVMLFEILTGELPFRGSPSMLIHQIVHEDPPSPRRFRADVPRALETICMKCLEKEPARRYSSALALADDLARYLRGEPIAARPMGRLERGWRWCRRNRAVAGLAATVLVTLTSGATAATYFALRANAERVLAVEAAQQAEHERELASRNAYSAQVARAATLAPYAPHETLQLLHDSERCPERLRDFVWHYLARLAHREQRALAGHTQPVNAVAFSPNDELLASASRDGDIRLWHTTDWSLRGVLKGHRGSVNDLAFLPDGKVLLSASSDWTVRRWDVATGRELDVIATEISAVQRLAVSPDGSKLAWASNGVLFWGDGAMPLITLCDAERLSQRKRLVGHKDSISALLFSADGEQLLSAACSKDPTIRVWDTRSGQQLGVLQGHTGSVSDLVITPDGKTLISAGERLRFWDLPTRAAKPVFAHNPSLGVNALAITPNGLTLALGQWSRDVTLVDAASGSHVNNFTGHVAEGVFTLAFSHDGKHLVSAGADHEVHVWDPVRGAHVAQELVSTSDRVVAVAATPDAALLLSAGRDDRLTLWQPETGRLLATWIAGHGEPHCVVLTKQGDRAFTAGRDGMIRQWDIASRRLLGQWRAHPRAARSLALDSRGERLVSCGDDGRVVVWNARRGTEEKTLASLATGVACLAMGPDGAVAAGAVDGKVRIWNLASAELLATISAHQAAITGLAFYPDGKCLATCSADTTAKIWELPTATCRTTFRPLQPPLSGIFVSPDGQTLVTTGYKLSLRDAVTGQERCSLEEPQGLVWCGNFSAAGTLLISGHDHGVVRIRRATR